METAGIATTQDGREFTVEGVEPSCRVPIAAVEFVDAVDAILTLADGQQIYVRLVATARLGYPFEEANGKRTSAAIPKGEGKEMGETDLTGLVQYPVGGVNAPEWRSNIDQVLEEAVDIINGHLAKTLNGLMLKFGHPLAME